jgi:hypothetical protein
MADKIDSFLDSFTVKKRQKRKLDDDEAENNLLNQKNDNTINFENSSNFTNRKTNKTNNSNTNLENSNLITEKNNDQEDIFGGEIAKIIILILIKLFQMIKKLKIQILAKM